jgi:Domain of unknown function (DUF4336)
MKTRMTVVRLGDGRLLLHSPVAIDDALMQALVALGPVGYLVAPNRFHHLRMPDATQRFPEARVFGAKGLREKARGVRVDEVLSEEIPAEWAPALDLCPVFGAPEMSEVAFFHKKSRTLLVSDLLFNIVEPEGLATKMVLTLMGTRGRLAKSRLWWKFTNDKKAFGASIEKIMNWDFDRLIMAHGNIVENDAKNRAAPLLRT